MSTQKEVKADVAMKIFLLEDPLVATWKYFSTFIMFSSDITPLNI